MTAAVYSYNVIGTPFQSSPSVALSHSLAIEYNRLRNVASVAVECNRLEWNARLRRFVAAACPRPRPQLSERIPSGNSKLYARIYHSHGTGLAETSNTGLAMIAARKTTLAQPQSLQTCLSWEAHAHSRNLRERYPKLCHAVWHILQLAAIHSVVGNTKLNTRSNQPVVSFQAPGKKHVKIRRAQLW